MPHSPDSGPLQPGNPLENPEQRNALAEILELLKDGYQVETFNTFKEGRWITVLTKNEDWKEFDLEQSVPGMITDGEEGSEMLQKQLEALFKSEEKETQLPLNLEAPEKDS